jgi:hypothetical protein
MAATSVAAARVSSKVVRTQRRPRVFFRIHQHIVETPSGAKCQLRHSCGGQKAGGSGLAVSCLTGQSCCIAGIGGGGERKQAGAFSSREINRLQETLQIIPGNT